MKLSVENINIISHEILTPLSILKMGIDNLEVSFAGRIEKDEIEIIEVLKRNIEKLGRLISNLQDLYRLESDQIGPPSQIMQSNTSSKKVLTGGEVKGKLLIIDDELDFANLLARRLRLAGYEVDCYYWGEGAFDTICKTLPDLILMDINLPDISGIDIYHQLKTNEEVKQIPIIFISAFNEKESHCRNFLKAEGFIKKPCDSALILQTIKKTLETRVKNN